MPETKPIILRSPMNGGTWQVPPDAGQEFLDAMLARGFTRVDDDDKPPKVKARHSTPGTFSQSKKEV